MYSMHTHIYKTYWDNDNIYIRKESHYLNEQKHREDGPAYIEYWYGNLIAIEEYYLNDKLHREDGPAFIYYHPNGNIKSKYYYLNDKELTESEWLVYQRKRKLNSLCK